MLQRPVTAEHSSLAARLVGVAIGTSSLNSRDQLPKPALEIHPFREKHNDERICMSICRPISETLSPSVQQNSGQFGHVKPSPFSKSLV